ncbi:MAG: tetratricopeptide repeat protein [Bacteroidales bacterium]|nr:tetratricopeptide repeat protein [Bacteroidales bacterium]
MKKIYLLMIMMMVVLGIKAQTIQNQEFAKANFYYNESQYDTALMIYEGIIEEGYVSAPLLYNIGNTYFKMRNYPMAILNYEKALKLEPNNDEIKQNLAIANALITDKIEPVPVFFMTRWWRSIGNLLSANGWAKASLKIFGILLVLLFFYFTARTKGTRKITFFTGILVLVIFICSIIFASQKHKYINEHNEAIVMTPTITVKSSPSSSGVDLFVLHEGTKVEIIDNTDKWDKIKIADGSVGWMPSSSTIKY